MKQQVINVTHTEEVEAAILGHLATDRALNPFLMSLTPEERHELPELERTGGTGK